MRFWPGHPRYLVKLLSSLRTHEAVQAERLVATARVVLALSGLAAVYLDPTQPTRFAVVAYGLLAAYAIHSLAVLAFLKIRPQPVRHVGVVLHSIDLVWSCSITSFTEGPSSPFFVFFVFLLVAAAYRWGLRETLATAALSILLLLLQAVLVTGPVDSMGREGDLEWNRVMIRAAYLALMGFLVGYLAEAEKRLRAETSFVARIMAKARSEIHFKSTLRFLFREFLDLFDAERVLLVTMETRTDRAFTWEGRRRHGEDEVTLESRELVDPAERGSYLFSFPAGSWIGRGIDARSDLAIDGDGSLLGGVAGGRLGSFLERHDLPSLAFVTYHQDPVWSARLFLFEPALGAADEEVLRFLELVANQIAPAVYNVYLLRRLRSQAGAIERARVARELHDGVLQDLISVEMQVDVLRRRTPPSSADLGGELGRLQNVLRQSVVQVRELMQQMKPVELEPREFLEFLAASVDKFGRDSGIAVRFHSELEEVRLSPRVTHELARIVQEALVNVRKHSRAKNVLVRFGAAAKSAWELVIDDDGKGFDFSGRASSADLDLERRGPIIIRERVRSIGGSLSVESSPGKGSRLEIRFPRETGIGL